MIRNYYTIAVRFLIKDRAYAFINLLGLVVGFTSFILISLFVADEWTYDSFTKADRLYRVVNIAPENEPWLKGMPQVPAQLAAEVPEIENYTRLLFAHGLMQAADRTFEENSVLFADPSFFHVFTHESIQGSTSFTHANSVILSEEAAKKYFGTADPTGATLHFTAADDTLSVAYTVAGVLSGFPTNAHFQFDFLMPYRESMSFQSSRGVYTYLLLRPGTAPDAVVSKFNTFNSKHHESWGNDASQSIRLQGVKEIHLHSKYNEEITEGGNAQALTMLAIAGALILVVGLINFINLSLARSIRRVKEIGIRKVLGALRRQVASQFLMESMSLLIIAALLAVAISQALLPVFGAFASKTISSQLLHYLPIIAVLVVVSGVMASAYPALLLSGLLPATMLRDMSNRQFLSGHRLRNILLTIQFAIAIGLMIGTFTIWRQLQFIRSAELGFDKEQVLVVQIHNPDVQRNYTTAASRLQKVTGVVQVSASAAVPGGDFQGWPYQLPAASSPTGTDEGIGTTTFFVDENYLAMMKIMIVRGRTFHTTAVEADAQNSLLVNESFADAYGWSIDEAIGKIIQYFNPATRAFTNATVVGVVKNFHFQSFHSRIEPLIIRLRDPRTSLGATSVMSALSVKISTPHTASLIDALKAEWKQIDPEYPFDFQFLDAALQKHYEKDQRFGELFLSFATISILITCLGLLGISMLTIEQRTKEIGIRKILGASPAVLIKLLSSQFVKLLMVAITFAMPVGYWAMEKWLSNFSYRVSVDAVMLAVAGLVVIVISLSVVIVQAWRASQMNPVDSLRAE